MKKLNYSIEIKAPKEKVWNQMIDPETYQIWTKAFSEGSLYEGEWKEGQEIKFLSPGKGGTVALMEKIIPYSEIQARHVAVIDPKNNVIRSGEEFRNWIGTREDYFFSEKNGITNLMVEMEVHPDFVGMFDGSWPEALKELKRLVEH